MSVLEAPAGRKVPSLISHGDLDGEVGGNGSIRSSSSRSRSTTNGSNTSYINITTSVISHRVLGGEVGVIIDEVIE